MICHVLVRTNRNRWTNREKSWKQVAFVNMVKELVPAIEIRLQMNLSLFVQIDNHKRTFRVCVFRRSDFFSRSSSSYDSCVILKTKFRLYNKFVENAASQYDGVLPANQRSRSPRRSRRGSPPPTAPGPPDRFCGPRLRPPLLVGSPAGSPPRRRIQLTIRIRQAKAVASTESTENVLGRPLLLLLLRCSWQLPDVRCTRFDLPHAWRFRVFLHG